MAKIKLIDYDPGVPYETQFGTCELCMGTGETQDSRFKFEYEDGTKEWVDGYLWDWGDKFEVYIDNTAAFAAWLIEQDFKPDFRIKGYSELRDLVDDYDDVDDFYAKEYYL